MKLSVASSLFCTVLSASSLFNVGSVSATPNNYVKNWPSNFQDAVYQAQMELLKKNNEVIPTDPNDCGKESNSSSAGLMWFTAPQFGCRVASAPITYLNRDFQISKAETGDIISLPNRNGGDNVYFPTPKTKDCYYRGDAGCSSEDEFCMTDRHEKWGPYASSTSDQTARKECAELYYGWDISNVIDKNELAALNKSVVDDYCGGAYCGEDGICTDAPGKINSINPSGPLYKSAWLSVRGTCVKYRKKGQSCYMMQHENIFYDNPFLGTADSTFNEGGGIDRPFVCGPSLECKDIGSGINTCVDPSDSIKSLSVPRKKWETCGDNLPCDEDLVCTEDHIHVLNNTCVVPRPPDVCYAGSWGWDSTSCPRTTTDLLGEKPPCGGMTSASAQQSLFSTMLLAPSEVTPAPVCDYWKQRNYTPLTNNSGWPGRFDQLRENIYDTFDTLWPKHLDGFESIIPFEEIESDIFGAPLSNYSECKNALNKTSSECSIDSGFSNTSACILHSQLLYGGQLAHRAANVWSLIHWVMTNQKEFMSPEQVEASRAIAFILRDNWWCPDCRGFFTAGVLGVYGYPPISNKSEDHERYWNKGHNEASEHVATTRGGHPWLMQLADQSTNSGKNDNSDYQNPFFVTFEQARRQWKQHERNAAGECVYEKKTEKSSKTGKNGKTKNPKKKNKLM